MDNFKCFIKCFIAFGCENLKKEDANVTVEVDFIDDCETFRRGLSKSLKISKKFQKELKLTKVENEELIVRLDESNKKNEFLRN